MNSRTQGTIVIAATLMVMVIVVGGLISFSGMMSGEKLSGQELWSVPFPTAESMKIIDLTGDGQADLFVQNRDSVSILDPAGTLLYDLQYNSPDIATTMGDVNGDGIEDMIVFGVVDGALKLSLISRGEELWSVPVPLGAPSRAVVLRHPEGAQVVVGDMSGRLASFSAAGEALWQAQLSGADEVRGLDDARVNRQVRLAAANHDGAVAVYDSAGNPLWTYRYPGILRRMRAYDLDGDGNSELLVGGEANTLVVLDAATGQEKWSQGLGQTITEIRPAEIDGDPAAQEFVVGGKDGGVWAFRLNSDQLWSASVPDKVTEIAGMDIDEDGSEEIIIGDDSGEVNLFRGKTGERFNLENYGSGITRIDAGKLSGSDQLAVADGSTVRLLALDFDSLAGFRFSPLLVALIISALIGVTAWLVAAIPSRPPLETKIQDQTTESLLAERRMLKESIADVERLKSSGEMTPDAYLARLKSLRKELAENEAALRTAGVQIKPETFQCPNCGGTLELGVDRCEYCGQVVIA